MCTLEDMTNNLLLETFVLLYSLGVIGMMVAILLDMFTTCELARLLDRVPSPSAVGAIAILVLLWPLALTLTLWDKFHHDRNT